MAIALFYERINWENCPSIMTPLNEVNLNKLDYGVMKLNEMAVELDTAKANQSTVLNTVTDWSMDEETGIITITKVNGEQIMFDLNIEKIPVKFELSQDGILSMTTDDGSAFTANIGSMIPVLTFNSSDTISVLVSGEGVNKTYSFSVKNGSITEEKLQPNYLADIKVQAENAELSASNSAEYASNSANSATESKEYAESSEASALRSEEAAKKAESVSGIETMTLEKNGIGRPDGETLTVDESGVIKVKNGVGLSEESTVSFTEATDRTNITTTDSLKILFGKIAKWFSDLKTVAFTGSYNDLDNKPIPINSLLATVQGTALDAVQGRVLNEKIITVSDSLQWKKIDIDYTIPNTNTSYHTIGTYEELINCKEIIIQSSGYQNYFINNGDEIMFRKYQATQIANDSYVSEYGFKVNFSTGLVSGRQYIKGSSTNYGVLSAIYYR